VVLFVLVVRALRPFPRARTLWWLGSAALVVFFVVVVVPDQDRYAGPIMLVFLSAVWFAAASPTSERSASTGDHARGAPPGGRRLAVLFGVVLGAQIVALVAIEPWVSTRPFSPDRAIAQAATTHHVQDALVSGNDFDATSVSGYLDHDTYSVARGTPGCATSSTTSSRRAGTVPGRDRRRCAPRRVSRASGSGPRA
jgi:hypothetical protein